MARRIYDHTRLTPAESAEYHGVLAEFRSLWGTHGSPEWQAMRAAAPRVWSAGKGLEFPAMMAAVRAAVAEARALLGVQ